MVFAPLNKKKKELGELLVEQGVITEAQLKSAEEQQAESGEKLEEVLMRLEYAPEEKVLSIKAIQGGFTYLKLNKINFSEELRKLIPLEMVRKFNIMPVSHNGDVITIAMVEPDNVVIMDEVKAQTNLKVTSVLASLRDIENAIEKLYGGLAGLSDLSDAVVEEIKDSEEEDTLLPEGEYDAHDAPIVKYVNTLIHEGVRRQASDVHLEPLEEGVSLRLRIDGKLRDFPGPAKRSFSAIVSRIKIMGNLDIAERRLPQDGKCRVKVVGNKVDIRVSTLPTIHGEKVVMRILQRSSHSLALDDMGFSEDDLDKYKEALENPYGMIMVTGPTGSGKTTTLYGGLSHINRPESNIITIEDPVEFELSRINQVQVKPVIGLTFAEILRRVMRQDPDIIMVGEIRDTETAEIAIQSALTGHLVLSTLHTNDAVGTLSRLKFMGIDSFLIADAVQVVMAQRLVRKICPICKEKQEVPDNIIKKLDLKAEENVTFYYGKGCDECLGTGYSGRIAVYEVCKLTQPVKKLIMTEAADYEIKDKAMEEGMRTLREGAIDKLKEGITTVEEVLTVTFS
ncbi:MAG: ATPase, T2SS/T4P/T4SS family [Elusimicrobiota bacterium]